MKKPESCTAHAMRTTTRKCKEAALNLLAKKKLQSLNCTLPLISDYAVGKRTRAASSKSSSMSIDDDITSLTSVTMTRDKRRLKPLPPELVHPPSPADTGDENSQPPERRVSRRRTIHQLEHQMVNHHDESSNNSLASSSVSSYMTTSSEFSQLPNFLAQHLNNTTKSMPVKEVTKTKESESAIPVPGWRVKPIAVGFRLEGTENTSDDVYAKRHQRHETDEIKIKRRDIRRQYENYLREKMMLKEGRKVATSTSNSQTNKKNPITSIPDDGHIYSMVCDEADLEGNSFNLIQLEIYNSFCLDLELESILIVDQRDLAKARVAPKLGDDETKPAVLTIKKPEPVLNTSSKRSTSSKPSAHNNKENSSLVNKTSSIFSQNKRITAPTSTMSKKRLISSIYDDIDSDYKNNTSPFDFPLNTSPTTDHKKSKTTTTITPPRRRSLCSQITNSNFFTKSISSPVRKRQKL